MNTAITVQAQPFGYHFDIATTALVIIDMQREINVFYSTFTKGEFHISRNLPIGFP